MDTALVGIGNLYRRQSDGTKELLSLLSNPYSAQVCLSLYLLKTRLIRGRKTACAKIGLCIPWNLHRLYSLPSHRILPSSALQHRRIRPQAQGCR